MLRAALAVVLVAFADANLSGCKGTASKCTCNAGGQQCTLSPNGYSCADYNGYETSYCQSYVGGSGGSGGSSGGTAGSCPGLNMDKWECPKSWTTGGTAPSDAPDAKAFVAVHNIYRCMHNVQAVQWDSDVYAGAEKWAQYTGTSMSHSHSGTAYRKASDGENLAGTFEFSKKKGVDATHMWYEEIVNPCGWKKSCFQSFNAGHFTAMIWKSINKIAYSDTTGELAVGRYRDCLGNGPNFNEAYTTYVPPPVNNWEYCANKVLRQCPAFSGLSDDDVEGCESSSASESCSGGPGCIGGWHTHMVYATTCKNKYARITSQVSRLYGMDIPQILQPLMSNPWPVAFTCGSAFLLFFGISVRRFSAGAETPRAANLLGEENEADQNDLVE